MEVTLVLVLLGTLSFLAFAVMEDTRASLREEVDVMKSRIRYAQAKAMGSNTAHGVSCNGNSYFLFSGTNTNNRRIFPGENAEVVPLASGISASAFVVSFNEWGEPFANAALSTELNNNLTITVSLSLDGETESETLTVTAGTGFVP